MRTTSTRIARALFIVAAFAAGCETPTDLPPPPKQASAGSVSGQVVVNMPGSSQQLPAVGAKVQLLATSVATTTDSMGRFLLTPVTQSTGEILIQADPDSNGNYQHQQLFDLATIGAGPGHDISLGVVALSQNAIVIGRALKGDDATATTGQGGTAVFVPQGPFTTYTGDNGSYELDNLPAGTITLTFFRSGYAPATVNDIVLQPGEAIQLRDELLTPAPMAGPTTTGTLTGQVTFNPPVSDDTQTQAVAIGSAAQTPFNVSADGTYSVTLAEGVYTLQFGFAGYLAATVANVLVLPMATTPVSAVTLVPGTSAPDAGPSTTDAGTDAGPPAFSAPTATINSTGAAAVGARMTLNGTESTAEFEPAGIYLSFAWTEIMSSGISDVTSSFSANDSVLASTLSFTAPSTPQSLTFQLTVTDTRTGLTGTAMTSVQVVNPPAAVVTPATQTVFPGDPVAFSGAGSTDPSGGAVTYAWTTTSPTINLSGQSGDAAIQFAAPQTPGTYTVQLVVSDPMFTAAPATGTVTVALSPPTASIESLGIVKVGATASLDGSQSFAPSAPPGQFLSYAWSQTMGTAVTFSVNNSVAASAPTFTAPATAQTLGFSLTVTDTRSMLTANATITMQVVTPPIAVVSPVMQTAFPGNTVTFDGSGSTDPSGDALRFSWTTQSGAINLAGQSNQSAITFPAPQIPGTYTVQLVVNDPLFTSAPVAATLTVAFSPPLAGISAPGVAKAGSMVTLDGTQSAAPFAPAGLDLSYAWTQTQGTAVTLSANNSVTASSPTFTAPATAQTLAFSLTVTDTRSMLTATATTSIQVVIPPVAVVTPMTQTASPGNTVTFDGSGSTDPSGNALTYSWSSQSGAISLAGQSTLSAITFAAPPAAGTYTVQLVVSDPLSSSSPLTATLTVAYGNPVARIDSLGVVKLGGTFQLDGSQSSAASAAPGQFLSYHWAQTQGDTVTFSNNDSVTASAPTITAPNMLETLGFSLTVTDTRTGGTGSATTTVDVVNPPIAVITPATQIVHPGAMVTFDGSSSTDPAGGALSYAWSSMSAGVVLTGTTASSITFTAPMTLGTYAVQLVVNDPLLTSDPVQADVEVVTANVAPTLSLATSETVAAGAIVQMTVTGTAPDPITYSWTQTSGTTVSLANAASATASFTAPNQYAHLVFQVTGTSMGGSASASITVDVIATNPPVIVSSDPPSDGALGPWLMATATFNVPLNFMSVTTSTAFITDSTGATVASNVVYDSPTQTIRVLPLVPLNNGSAYVLNIGSVQDTSPAPITFPGATLHFNARPITWTTWSDANVGVYPPNPGVAANDQEAFVFATYETYNTGSPCVSISGGANYGAVPLSPNSMGTFTLATQCIGVAESPFGRRGMNVAGTLFGMEQDDLPGWPQNGYTLYIYEANATGFANLGESAAMDNPEGEFTDGERIYSMDIIGYNAKLFPWSSSTSWGAPEQLPNLSGFSAQGDDDFIVETGTGGGGNVFVVGRANAGINAGIFVFESAAGGAWAQVDGTDTTVNGTGAVAAINASDSYTGIPRGTMVGGTPVFAWSANGASQDEIDAAVLDSSTMPPTWRFANQLNEAGSAVLLDITGRGNAMWLAYVAADGLLRLRRTDFTSLTAPVTVDIPGPGGAAYLNVNPACAATHPEIADTNGAVYVTWAESCNANQYVIELRELQ